MPGRISQTFFPNKVFVYPGDLLGRVIKVSDDEVFSIRRHLTDHDAAIHSVKELAKPYFALP